MKKIKTRIMIIIIILIMMLITLAYQNYILKNELKKIKSIPEINNILIIKEIDSGLDLFR